MTIDLELQDMPSTIINANAVKTMVLEKLYSEEIISKEIFEEYEALYNVIIIKPNWFKSWVNKFKKDDLKGYVYKYVKF